MKVIFTGSVPGVATTGDIKNVKEGFFRNFLLPRGKAIFATVGNMKVWEKHREKMMIEKQQLKAKFEEIRRRLSGAKLRIDKKVTAKGTLYGGVKPADIARAVNEQFKIEVPEAAVVIDTPIKTIGSYELKLELGEGIETMLPIEVVEKK